MFLAYFFLTSRQALRSSAHGELLVPRARSALKEHQAFSVIGPSTWNELPLTLLLQPDTLLFGRSWTESASE